MSLNPTEDRRDGNSNTEAIKGPKRGGAREWTGITTKGKRKAIHAFTQNLTGLMPGGEGDIERREEPEIIVPKPRIRDAREGIRRNPR